MIQVDFYNFTKRPESTKLPDVPAIASYQALLWEDSSVDSPALKLRIDHPVGSYCRIPSFNRYYFVKNWEYREGFWWAQLDVDVLANGRAALMASTQYITRSSVGYNSRLIDNTRPAEARTVSTTTSAEILDNTTEVIITVAGTGGCKLYACPYSSFVDVSKFMFLEKQDTLWETIVAATAQNFVKTFIDPFQYLLSCHINGFSFSAGSYADTITLGYWTTPGRGRAWAPGAVGKKNVTLSVPKHPDASGLGSYLVSEPYSSYTLTLPGIGTCRIPAIRLWDVDTITINVCYGIDGSVEYEVRTPSNVIARYTTCIKSELPITAASPDIVGAVSSIMSGIGGSNPATAAVKAVNGVGNAIEALTPDVNSTGGTSGKAATILGQKTAELCGTFYKVAPSALSINGAPRCSTGNLNSPGYYLVEKAQVSWCETEAEAEKTKRLMEGGIYVE